MCRRLGGLVLALGLAPALLSPPPAMGAGPGGPLDCGVLAAGGPAASSPIVITEDQPDYLIGVSLDLPCPGPVIAKAVLELEAPTDVELRVSFLVACLDSEVGGAGSGPGCVVGSTTTFTPSAFIVVVPFQLNAQVVGPSTYTVTASGTLARGTYVGVVAIETIGGPISVSRYTAHVLSGGTWTPLAGR